MKKSVTLSALVLLALVTGHALAAPASTVGAPAGSTISNTASMDYVDDNNAPGIEESPAVITTVERVAGISVTPDTQAGGAPGQTNYGRDGQAVVLEYLALNSGNNADNFNITLTLGTGVIGANASIYVDANDNGTLDVAERVSVTTTGAIGQEQSRKFWISYAVPAARWAAPTWISPRRWPASSILR